MSSGLGVEPGRLALLQEGLHALAAFVARADVGDALDGLRDQRVVDLTARHVGDELLARAHRIGFVHEVVGAEGLDAKVAELTNALSSASPNAVRSCKALVQEVAGRGIEAPLIGRTVEGIADIRTSSEGREGVQSFLQKRKPSWLG
jgi:hypothetical protein